MSRRILFYVHFNKYDGLADYVLYQLEKLRPLYERVIFISNSTLPSGASKKLVGSDGKLVDKIIQRENKGFDFAAWRDGILEEGWDRLAEYDWLTIMNDTCFGPVYPLEPIYDKMENSGADFWGMTDSPQTKSKEPESTAGIINYHLMSFFVSFDRKVIGSNVFQEFWNNVKDYEDVVLVIKNYETMMTKILQTAGFCAKAVLPYENVENNSLKIKHTNLTIFHPDICLEKKMPFVKEKAFVIPYAATDTERYGLIGEMKDLGYNTQFVTDHLVLQHNPDTYYLLNELLIKTATTDSLSASPNVKIAVHIHAFYADVLENMLDEFLKTGMQFDFFITTTTQELATQIEVVVKSKRITSAEVSIVENKGRDILPWLSISNKLDTYDIVGHFHTKKSMEADEIIGKMWNKSLYSSLISNFGSILASFSNNPSVGVIIPDIPANFHYWNQAIPSRDKNIFWLADQLWSRIRANKKIHFANKSSLIFPYGTMFWYRPLALKKLIDYNFNDDEIPNEPLPQNSMLHAIERLIVYIVWDAGYTYRIAPSKYVSGFIDNMTYSSMIKDASAPAHEIMVKKSTKKIKHTFAKFKVLRFVYKKLRR